MERKVKKQKQEIKNSKIRWTHKLNASQSKIERDEIINTYVAELPTHLKTLAKPKNYAANKISKEKKKKPIFSQQKNQLKLGENTPSMDFDLPTTNKVKITNFPRLNLVRMPVNSEETTYGINFTRTTFKKKVTHNLTEKNIAKNRH